MPSLSSFSKEFVKVMLIGHSGAGKTGALTSLVKAGYKVRILDLDSGLDALINHVEAECPNMAANVDFMSFRDSYKIGPAGPQVAGAPRAFVNAVKSLDKWEDGSTPSEWGADSILVIDSLTNLGRAAFAWAKQMNPASKEPRQWYMAAQSALEDVIATATGPDFRTNLIVMSHIDLRTMPDGTFQGFATAIGQALGPKLPRYFNSMIALERKGQGKNVKRTLVTVPTSTLTLKNPAPMKIEAEYPIETGLATVFSKLSGKS